MRLLPWPFITVLSNSLDYIACSMGIWILVMGKRRQ
jgi:hypothetical protein